MTTSYPPPPPPPAAYAPRKARPDIVTKWSIVTLVAGILAIIFGVLDIAVIFKETVLIGAIFIVLGIYILISGIGMLAGQKWGLIMGGYAIMGWTKRPDVVEYFGLTPAYPAYSSGVPQTAPSPSAPTCQTCGQPLTYIQQYQRWYCQNCQKYVRV